MRPVAAFFAAACASMLACGLPAGGDRSSSSSSHSSGRPAMFDVAMLACQASSLNGSTFERVGRTGPGQSNRELFAAASKMAPKLRFVIEDGNVRLDGPRGAEASEILARMQALASMKKSIEDQSQRCHVVALQYAMKIEILSKYGQSITDPEREREASKKAVAVMKRFDAHVAATIGLLALYEAAAQGADASAIDKAARAAAVDASAGGTPATSEEVAAFWTLARDKANQIDTMSRAWGPKEGVRSERERRALLGLLGDGSAAPTTATAVDGPPAGADADMNGDVKLATSALLGLLHGDVGAVLRGAAVIFPKDSPIRAGLTAGGAVLQGDFVTALKSASTLAPKDSAIGAALSVASDVLAAPRSRT